MSGKARNYRLKVAAIKPKSESYRPKSGFSANLYKEKIVRTKFATTNFGG